MTAMKSVSGKMVYSAEANTLEYARQLDAQDPLQGYRKKFIFPTKTSLKTMKLSQPGRFPCMKL
jgi:hypothetical protein